MSDWSGSAEQSPLTPESSMPYAVLSDLATFLNVEISTLTSDNTRMLQRASELVSFVTNHAIDQWNQFYAALNTQGKSDNASRQTQIANATKNATCAQVEFWIERGEDYDMRGPMASEQLGKLTVSYGSGKDRVAPTYLCPRAARFLQMAGLLYRGAHMSAIGIGK